MAEVDEVTSLTRSLESALFRQRGFEAGLKKWLDERDRWAPGTRQWLHAFDEVQWREERIREEHRKVMRLIGELTKATATATAT